MKEIKCPKDLNQFVLKYPFENTFPEDECKMRKFYGDCFHCFASSITERDKEIRPKGKWIRTKNALGEDIMVCSECENQMRQGEINFCSACGSDNREVSE